MTKLHNVSPPGGELKSIGSEPEYSEGVVTNASYNLELLRALNWYNYVTTERDNVKFLEEWIKTYRPTTAKKDLVILKGMSAAKLCRTMSALARLELRGFPIAPEHKAPLEAYIINVVTPVRGVVKRAKKKHVGPTIQDRMRQQVSGVLSDFDAAIDVALAGEVPDLDLIKAQITSGDYKGPQLKLITDYLNTQISEWTKAVAKEDEQLVEAYHGVGVRRLKKIIGMFEDVVGGISTKLTKIKTQRIIKKKPTDKKKMASKIKSLDEFPELGLKSLAPVDIIGANMLWVYDTKKRKLGFYEAEVQGGLYVKATKIFGYKESCVKTLRKPEDQLSDFKKMRKNQTKNFLMAIRAKCGTMTGRTNEHLILLRID